MSPRRRRRTAAESGSDSPPRKERSGRGRSRRKAAGKASPTGRPARYICVLSDATGSTAERVVRATLSQFPHVAVTVDLATDVKTADRVREVVEKTVARQGLIAYTLVDERLRREIASLANEAGVETVDLLGPLMTALSAFLTATPAYEPGIFTQPGEEHYRLLDAVSFTVRHDDGQCLGDAHLADLVITGPSRTSKTPLSVYLAHTRGLRVANVPLALGMEPPAVLGEMARGRVVALTMRADVLAQVRRERLAEMGNPDIDYAQPGYIERELHFCHDLYRRSPGWAVVDVTGKSIEEIAGEVCAASVDLPAPPAEER